MNPDGMSETVKVDGFTITRLTHGGGTKQILEVVTPEGKVVPRGCKVYALREQPGVAIIGTLGFVMAIAVPNQEGRGRDIFSVHFGGQPEPVWVTGEDLEI